MKMSSVFTKAHCLSSILILAALGSSAPRAIAQKPSIVAQPKSQNICAGFNAVFNASASGFPPLYYQWQHDGLDVPGASGLDSPSLTLTNVQSAEAGAYHVVITNKYGNVTSQDAVLVVGTLAAWGNSWTSPTNLTLDLTNLVAIAAGSVHCLALRQDGTVAAWSTSRSSATNVPVDLSNVVGVAAGDNHSMALRSDGTVVAWGDNTYLQTNVPAGLTNVAKIAARGNWSMAIRADGTVVVWGGGGSDTTGVRNVPFGLKAMAVDAGAYHGLALTLAGTVVAWANTPSAQATVPAGLSNVVAIAAGPYSSLALKSDGTVVGWGQVTVPANATNIVAIAAGSFANLALRRDGTVLVLSGNANVPAGLTNLTALAAGGNHALALRNFGSPVLSTAPVSQTAWAGQSLTLFSVGQGGQPLTYQWQFNGVDIPDATDSLLTLSNIQHVNAGSYSVIISNSLGAVASPPAVVRVRQQATIAAWGGNGGGQCLVPPGLSNLVAIAGGGNRSLALREDGTVSAWGASGGFQSLAPRDLSNVVSIAAGELQHLALKADGRLACWGVPNSTSFTNVSLIPGNYIAIAAGAYHNLALRSDGTVQAWADMLDWPGSSTPPANAYGIKAIAAGMSHSLALTTSGAVVAWGNGFVGASSVPVGLSNVIGIACGYRHNLVLRDDGTVVAWGDNSRGQTNVPTDLSSVVTIAASGYHSLACKSDGTVVAWGKDLFGQTTVPEGLTNVLAIAAAPITAWRWWGTAHLALRWRRGD